MSKPEPSPIVATPLVVAGMGVLVTLGLSLAGTMAPDLTVPVALVGGLVAALVAPAVTGIARRGGSDSLEAGLAAASGRHPDGPDREDTLVESRRRLVAWVADDLQRPLARLRATAAALEDGVIDQPLEVAAALADMSHEIDVVAGVVDDLRELSHLPAVRDSHGQRGSLHRLAPLAGEPLSGVGGPLRLTTPFDLASGAGASTFDAMFRTVPDVVGRSIGARRASGGPPR